MTSIQSAKVRVACQRCRARRTRCDGGIPSCANCTKAGAVCVDVDARNAERLIPRNAIAQAKSRIQWLEDIISRELPHINLSEGPRVELELTGDDTGLDAALTTSAHRVGTERAVKSSHESPVLNSSSKRAYSSTHENETDAPFQTEARSVAHDLGRLSLNADSREKHYLGSSSGLIFSYLVQTGSPSDSSDLTRSRARSIALGRRRIKQDYTEIYQKLPQILPSKEDVYYLFELYIYHIHPDHPVLHISSVWSALEAVFLCRDTGVHAGVDDDGWVDSVLTFAYNGENSTGKAPIKLPTAVFHILLMCAIAASIKPGDEVGEHTPPTVFFRAAMAIAPDVLGETSIASLQAIYLMSIYALMSPTNLNLWTLNYISMAHCIDLGLQRTQSSSCLTTRVVRSLLFYSVYALDRSLATIQGRPLGLRDETFDVQPPSLDELYRELDSQDIPTTYKALAEESPQYFLHRFKLDKIISEIKSTFYFLPPHDLSSWATDNANRQPRMRASLDKWFGEIGSITSRSVVRDQDRRRWQLHLELAYHAAIILLYQPSHVFKQPSSEALQQCLNAASAQLSCFNKLNEQDSLQFDWRTVRSVFACGATIVYCFWTATTAQSVSQRAEISASLRLCSNLLAIGSTTWPSVKKGRVSFERLVDITLRKMNEVQQLVNQPHKKRLQTYETALNSGQNALGRHTAPIGGLDISTTVPAYSASQSAVQAPATDVQWSSDDLDVSGYADMHGGLGDPMLDGASTYGFLEAHSQSSHVEPEIESFLTEFFMDEGSWGSWDTTSATDFHYG